MILQCAQRIEQGTGWLTCSCCSACNRLLHNLIINAWLFCLRRRIACSDLWHCRIPDKYPAYTLESVPSTVSENIHLDRVSANLQRLGFVSSRLFRLGKTISSISDRWCEHPSRAMADCTDTDDLAVALHLGRHR